MKREAALLFSIYLLFGLSGAANAALTTIGTATYLNNDYKLIYEDDNNGQGLIWLDYTNGLNNWESQINWAAGLNTAGVLTLSPNPGVKVTSEGVWRLPITGDNTAFDYNQTTAEMGHLHYVSLGNPAGLDAFQHSYPFENLNNPPNLSYWSGTEYPVESNYYAWCFQFEYGIAGPASKLGVGYGMAVLPVLWSFWKKPESVRLKLDAGSSPA